LIEIEALFLINEQMLAETISMIMDDEDKRLDCHVLDCDRDKELLKLQKLISTKDALQFGIDGGIAPNLG
jgi:hypothetical protein